MAKNPFRNKMMCDQYDACLQAYRNGLSGLFTPEGNPHRGSAIALAFWNGFEGVTMGKGFTTQAERSTPAYACWRAGQDCQRAETSDSASS